MEVKRLAFVLSMAVTPAAFARDPGWYLGGSVGPSDYSSVIQNSFPITGVCIGCDTDTVNATGWSVLGGYRFNPHFALEMQYFDMGSTSESGAESSVSNFFSIKENTQFKLTGYGMDAVGSIPMNEFASLFVKLGVVTSRLDENETGFFDTADPGLPPTMTSLDATRSATKTDRELGIGIEFALSRHWSMRIGYTGIHDVGDTDTGTGNVNFMYLSALLYF